MGKTERIELHCHTKMGGNATVYVGEIISHLSDISVDAVAITDTSNIYAFTEMDSLRMSKYSTRPIYGMEALINISWINTPASFSILVKDEIGKKSIFRIISTIDENAKYPIFDIDDIKRNRDGLLFGTGTRNGILYLMAEQGATDDELSELIDKFDYVEVVPDADCKEITKRFIVLAEKANIPVVAVSDAHYIDKKDKLAWKVLQYWEDSSVLNQDRHFYTTEEMLNSFDYLSNDKAYEIVVTNTHKVADMCGNITVIPKEFEMKRIPNDNELLKERCEKAIQTKYKADNRAVAEALLKTELEAIEYTGSATQMLLAGELVDKLNLDANYISVRATTGGSISAYLLGITNVDPTQYNLPWEFSFGLKKDRRVGIDINIPSLKQEEALKVVGQINRINAAIQTGFTNSVSPILADAMIERYEEDHHTYFDEKEHDQIRMKLVGNYRKRVIREGGFLFTLESESIFEDVPIVSNGENFTTYFSSLHYSMFYSINMYPHKTLDIIKRLSERTGVDISAIPADDKSVIDFLCRKQACEDADYSDIPEFRSEYVKEIIEITKPQTFDDLVKVLALSHGTDIWEGNEKILFQNGHITIGEAIAAREDVFDTLIAYNIDRETAYTITESVRKGIVSRARNMQWTTWKKLLVENGVPSWFIKSCETLKYVFPRAHSISYLIMYVKFVWFKLNYPVDFAAVLDEMSIE